MELNRTTQSTASQDLAMIDKQKVTLPKFSFTDERLHETNNIDPYAYLDNNYINIMTPQSKYNKFVDD